MKNNVFKLILCLILSLSLLSLLTACGKNETKSNTDAKSASSLANETKAATDAAYIDAESASSLANETKAATDAAYTDAESASSLANETKAATDAAYTDAESISSLAIEEFLSFTKIPRPSYSTSKVLSYLQSFADSNGFKHFRDDYGNFWMDIPAAKGCEKYPKVILQAHMDMVCVSESGDDMDFKNTGITAIVNEDEGTITADGTSLGADDGMGMGIILAIAKSNYPHGPIRALITTDEEVGLVGASELDGNALDSDYLINLDNETVGNIVFSSAGTLRSELSKKYGQAESLSHKGNFRITIEGLLGGHSGTDIGKNRLSSVVTLAKILEKARSAGVDLFISEISCGDAFNAIPRNATAVFMADADANQLKKITNEALSELKTQYPDEKITCSIDEENGTEGYFLSVEDTDQIINMLSALPQGVINMSETKDGLVQTSNNIGIVELKNGTALIQLCGRSCVTEDINRLEEKLVSLAEKHEYNYEQKGWYPGWDGDPESPLLLLMEKGFDSAGVKPVSEAIHAGLECSWFAEKRKGIQIVSIGATLTDCHTPRETLLTDSVKPTVSAVLYCLGHIEENNGNNATAQ